MNELLDAVEYMKAQGEDNACWRCKILQIRMSCERDTFGAAFNTLVFQDEIDIIDDGRDLAICILTDEASHIQTVFTVSEFRPDYKITTVVIKPNLQTIDGDLLINIFALPLCRPVLNLFPLRRKVADENRPRRIATLAKATLTTDGPHAAYLTVSADGIRWGKSVDSISGRFRIFSTLVTKVSELYGLDGKIRFRFARLVWSSDSYGEISKLVLNHDVLNLYLSREENRHLGSQWLRQTPPNGLCLRLRLTSEDEETLHGPYFSGAGSPYFLGHGKYIEITAPYDFTVSKDHVHRLRTYRKYYGSYVGIFVPKFDARLRMTPEIWYPRNWLDITISVSENRDEITIFYGDILGRVYFSDTEYDFDPYHEDEYADEVRSRIVKKSHEPETENVSFLGLTVIHDHVPDLRVKSNGRDGPVSRTLMRVLAQ